jgi:hypothetical protein
MERPDLDDYKDEIHHPNEVIEDIWRHSDYVDDLNKYIDHLEKKVLALSILSVSERGITINMKDVKKQCDIHVVVKSLPCGDCENYAEYDGALKICSNCGTSL